MFSYFCWLVLVFIVSGVVHEYCHVFATRIFDRKTKLMVHLLPKFVGSELVFMRVTFENNTFIVPEFLKKYQVQIVFFVAFAGGFGSSLVLLGSFLLPSSFAFKMAVVAVILYQLSYGIMEGIDFAKTTSITGKILLCNHD